MPTLAKNAERVEKDMEVNGDTTTIAIPVPLPRPSKRKIQQANATNIDATKTVTTTTVKTLPVATTFDSKVVFKRTPTKKKTYTALLCELTRLKTQQKYLECNQVKLKPESFQDLPLQPSSTAAVSSSSTSTSASAPATVSPTTPTTAQLINEIEQLKIDLNAKLIEYREVAKHEVLDLRQLVGTIRDDVTQPERLCLFSMTAIRERIIGINKHLDYLRAKNACQLESLQQECLQLERNIKFRIK